MRIAVVQCSNISDNAHRAGDAIVQRLRWADEQGVSLTLFPEAYLLGHSYDPETINSRASLAASAIDSLCKRVAAFHSVLVVGAFDIVDGQIFNSAIIIEAGRVVGRYAKAHPNEPGVIAGGDFPTFLRSGFRYGVNICNDANHPGPAQRIADQAARVILYPLNNMLPLATADRWREKSLANLIDRARQTGCWVASSDVTGTSGNLVSYGCTAIVTPEGSVVARVPELQEGAAVYEVPSR
ncbi:carbon-nitrogen hydrolase family protein [Novosphingobium sp. KCTC 2891]|uniref:carbon-nitrogen hydrolase family protein n=1 Tax=Novosphingobium sp. KCTC 2891 TaxID=2989730 RepID=UPI0022215DF6|nr:carbon-nitrogen hydrolase family protein [Novosphingobium sp. KCTC 2891]MCW1381977.1 carbon-nitrogen hydrolase family protein [Novosphingobium sp. KCTC 2891]